MQKYFWCVVLMSLLIGPSCREGERPAAGASPETSSIPDPVIDMHLHALGAADQGPPPQRLCAPIPAFPARDPLRPWSEIFMEWTADAPCLDPLVSPATDELLMQQTLEILERRNITAVTSGSLDRVERWKAAAPDRIVPGLSFGVMEGALSPQEVRELYVAGRFQVFGEVFNQYLGVGPDDERFEPYLAVCEELDIPVALHVGPGPPGAPYLGSPDYRARLHDPLALEEVLLRHPRLRLYVMHAGWPMLENTLALLYAHPQVYVDVGIIVWGFPRNDFYHYLRRLVEAGFGSRVLFGSDQMVWPGAIEKGIDSIESADFLSNEQKRDILYNNAARFLRLDGAEARR